MKHWRRRADAARIAAGPLVMAMHKFYPRPETSLGDASPLETTKALQAAGLKVLVFIPGDGELRGPALDCFRNGRRFVLTRD